MKSGFLIYKCRKCNELTKNVHVPNGLMQVCDAVSNADSLKLLNVHSCKNGNLGISDLIGFEEDNEKK